MISRVRSTRRARGDWFQRTDTAFRLEFRCIRFSFISFRQKYQEGKYRGRGEGAKSTWVTWPLGRNDEILSRFRRNSRGIPRSPAKTRRLTRARVEGTPPWVPGFNTLINSGVACCNEPWKVVRIAIARPRSFAESFKAPSGWRRRVYFRSGWSLSL